MITLYIEENPSKEFATAMQAAVKNIKGLNFEIQQKKISFFNKKSVLTITISGETLQDPDKIQNILSEIEKRSAANKKIQTQNIYSKIDDAIDSVTSARITFLSHSPALETAAISVGALAAPAQHRENPAFKFKEVKEASFGL